MPRPLFALARAAAPAADPDADLLARFVSTRDAAAFAELVRRHGPAVLGTCRRLVGPAAADDAFQATFLVLAVRAGSVRKAASVGSWLVGVAGRVGRRMRRGNGKPETGAGEHPEPACRSSPVSGLLSAELAAILADEFTRLPDRLRAAAVACLVDGRTQDAAAAALGWSARTVRRRLDEAKALLRVRLERRGVAPAAVAAALTAGGATAVPAALARRVADAASLFLAGGGADTPAAALAQGVLGTMTTIRATVAAAACVVVSAGLGLGWPGAAPAPNPPPAAKAAPEHTPPKAAPPKPAAAAYTHKTANFVVEAPTEAVARAVGDAFERGRRKSAVAWSGAELQAWKEPATVKVRPSDAHTGVRYEAEVRFNALGRAGDGGVFGGDLEGLIGWHAPVLADRFVVHTLLDAHPPHWARTALWLLSAPDATPASWQNRIIPARRRIEDGTALRLAALFRDGSSPPDSDPQAQGEVVARFLLSRAPDLRVAVFEGGSIGLLDRPAVMAPGQSAAKRGLLTFLQIGAGGHWDMAAKDVYGFASVADLERAWVAWVREQPVAAAPPADPDRIPPPAAGTATHRTANFAVTAPTADAAKRVADAAEKHRRELAKQWLGKELPAAAEPVPATVTPAAGGAGGTTTFTFGDADGQRPPRATATAMELHGPFRQILESALPHEVMHVVLAGHFGRPVPRWADEGIAVLAESAGERFNHDVRAWELLNAGRAIRLAVLFRMTEYPRDMVVTFAQGYSVCRFLVTRGPEARAGHADPRAALLAFVGRGMDGNTAESWAAAAKDVYGFDSLDALEQAWIESLREPPARPAADPERIPPPARR